MPRLSRLDPPGFLQYVMARGIENRDIFTDDEDRTLFLSRLAVILESSSAQCYAWTLIPNHFHLLIRTGPAPLREVMRRLMMGYALYFNRRHDRMGHLFQNRYKSLVCEDEPSMKELVEIVAEKMDLNPDFICYGSRRGKYSKAKMLVVWLAVEEAGYSCAEVARHLKISQPAVSMARDRAILIGKQGGSWVI